MTTQSHTAGETATAEPQVLVRPDSDAKMRMRAQARARLRHLAVVWQRVKAIALGDDQTIWSAKPDSAAEVVRYARDGAWCQAGSQFVRAAGRLYAFLVSIPATALLDLVEWVLQRPGRLVVAILLAGVCWLLS